VKTISQTLNLVSDGLPFFQAEWPAPANVKTLVSTRNGGVSQAPYASLNVGGHVGDRPENVARNREIVQGGCWDYLHAGFNRAGIPAKRRQTLFSGTLRGGPYAPAELLEPGDWLYYVNHSYNDIEHSGVFIGWTDYEQRQGLILSYAGEGRGEPGRYKVYDLSHVYQVMRPR